MSKGGGGYDPEPQFEYDKELLNFNWEQLVDKKKRADDIFAIKLENQRNNLDFQDQERINAWQNKMDMATYDWNNQVAARIASEEAVGKQLYFNELAEEIAINSSTRQYNERLTAIGFQNEDLLAGLADVKEDADWDKKGVKMNLNKIRKDIGLQTEGVGINFKDVIGKSELAKAGLTIQHKGKVSELSAKARDIGLKSLEAAGQYAAMGSVGRSQRKAMLALMGSFSRQENVILDVLENTNSQYNLEFDKINQNVSSTVANTNLQYKKLASEFAFAEDKAQFDILKIGSKVGQVERKTERGERQLKESMKSAEAQHEANKSKFALEKYGADLQAEASLAPEPTMPPTPREPALLPRPKSVPPADLPSWDRVPKPRKGTAGSSAGALSNFLSAAGTVAGIIGTVATVAPALSDDRLKYNINKVGNSKKGIPIYTFKYRFEGKHGPTYKGTSAQDLIAMGRKDAVVQKEKDGFYSVDYSKLDVDMEVVTT